MQNAAGVEGCDEFLKKELEEAKIPYHEYSFKLANSEVPTHLIDTLEGWTFKRAWRYWAATTDQPLLFTFANRLHAEYGEECRVSGNCGAPSPREEYKYPWCLGVVLYHVDTQEALNALAQTIKEQTKYLLRTKEEPVVTKGV